MCYGTRTVVKDQPLQSENDDMLWRMCGLRSRVLREWLPLVTLNVAAARVLCLSATLLWMSTAIETRGAENSSQPPRQSVQEANGWTGVALAGPTGGLEEIVFAVRSVIPEHWYANFGYFSPDAKPEVLRQGRPAVQAEPQDRQADRAGGRSRGGGPRSVRRITTAGGSSSPIARAGPTPITSTKSTPMAPA